MIEWSNNGFKPYECYSDKKNGEVMKVSQKKGSWKTNELGTKGFTPIQESRHYNCEMWICVKINTIWLQEHEAKSLQDADHVL